MKQAQGEVLVKNQCHSAEGKSPATVPSNRNKSVYYKEWLLYVHVYGYQVNTEVTLLELFVLRHLE